MSIAANGWERFVSAGDDWIFTYALTCAAMGLGGHLFGPRLFAIGHAMELYLKAVYLHSHPDATPREVANNFDHDIRRLLDECKHANPDLLHDYEIRMSIWSRGEDMFSPRYYDGLMKKRAYDEVLHFAKHQELYMAAKALQDLKYYPVPMPSLAGPFGFAHIAPNPYWSTLFRELRGHLNQMDPLRLEAATATNYAGELSASDRYFLWEVYEDDLRRMSHEDRQSLMENIERSVKRIDQIRHESDPAS
jgi:hypothetical protein